jgi:hypothetical protein
MQDGLTSGIKDTVARKVTNKIWIEISKEILSGYIVSLCSCITAAIEIHHEGLRSSSSSPCSLG